LSLIIERQIIDHHPMSAFVLVQALWVSKCIVQVQRRRFLLSAVRVGNAWKSRQMIYGSIWIQIATFALVSIFRPLFFATTIAMFQEIFGLRTFGRVFGISQVIISCSFDI
jgi:hypothetical protein